MRLSGLFCCCPFFSKKTDENSSGLKKSKRSFNLPGLAEFDHLKEVKKEEDNRTLYTPIYSPDDKGPPKIIPPASPAPDLVLPPLKERLIALSRGIPDVKVSESFSREKKSSASKVKTSPVKFKWSTEHLLRSSNSEGIPKEKVMSEGSNRIITPKSKRRF